MGLEENEGEADRFELRQDEGMEEGKTRAG